MATQIYLGAPPTHIEAWIKAHSKPAGNPKTKIMFIDGTSQEYDWSGEIDTYTITNAGLFKEGYWVKTP